MSPLNRASWFVVAGICAGQALLNAVVNWIWLLRGADGDAPADAGSFIYLCVAVLYIERGRQQPR